jgi:hypothetical protein
MPQNPNQKRLTQIDFGRLDETETQDLTREIQPAIDAQNERHDVETEQQEQLAAGKEGFQKGGATRRCFQW